MEGGWTRVKILQTILSDFEKLNADNADILKFLNDFANEGINTLDAFIDQMKESSSRPLVSKTPKLVRKKNYKPIETIPEDESAEIEYTSRTVSKKQSNVSVENLPLDTGRKSKREASKKADEFIKKQQSITLNSKMRRPSEDSDDTRQSKASSRDSKVKRLRSVRSSDEEETYQPKKQIKKEPRSSSSQSKQTDEDTNQPKKKKKNGSRLSSRSTRNKQVDEEAEFSLNEDEIFDVPRKKLRNKRKLDSMDSRASKRTHSPPTGEPESKKANIIDETIDGTNSDDTIEPSMYEDAIGKAVPIMNSTMKPTSLGNQTRVISQTFLANQTRVVSETPLANQTRVISQTSLGNQTRTLNSGNGMLTNCTLTEQNKMMNVTVVLEKVKRVTEVVAGSSTHNEKSKGSLANRVHSPFIAPDPVPRVTLTKLKPVVDSLITDDESSPERKLPRAKKLYKKLEKKETSVKSRRLTRSSLMSDDEVDLTPGRKVLGEVNGEKIQEKNKLKKNTLFSPYAKESVKKKIEAFEQAVLSNPVEVESGMRLTRTKTRALAASNDSEQSNSTASITQKLARKSLAKAKQISRAKDAKDHEDTKENPTNLKLPVNEKLVQKQQQRTTPNSKNRPQLPSSVNRGGFTTPSNHQSLANYSKAMTGSRTNIVTNVDTFLHTKSSAQKPSSNDKLEERRRKQEEDTKKKRDELLKAQMEEKKRKREEKEQKNRLAREAKEKQEMERRLQLEKDKADKEKKMLQLQEFQKIEHEKKRLAYQKRVLEKEEKRKQEEEIRLQRLRDQEETERLLAEQKRREQELDKRRIAELKAQQAASENAKMKALLSQAQAKKLAIAQSKQPINSYKIDSEPDSESEDELRPKHEIPIWAKSTYRHKHLVMQEHVPMQAVMRLFDVKKCTPDLSELFQGIDKSRLKRTSSAIWKTPPRFSMMDAIN